MVLIRPGLIVKVISYNRDAEGDRQQVEEVVVASRDNHQLQQGLESLDQCFG